MSLRPALLCALLAAAGCAGPRRAAPPPGDAELARVNSAARASFDRGSLPLAARLWEQSLTRARALDDAVGIGNAAYNLSACRIAEGHYEPARALLREAEVELARAKSSLADVLVLQAKLARWQGRAEEALGFADAVLSNPASAPQAAHRAEAALVNGQLACDARDAARARTALGEAQRQSHSANSVLLCGDCERLQGAIHVLEGDSSAAAGAFDREAALRRQAGWPREMARALRDAGEAWRGAGEASVAADRYLRAARSFFAQGSQAEADACIGLCLTLSQGSQDAALQQRAKRLQAEMRAATARAP